MRLRDQVWFLWYKARKRFRRCPECRERGYGGMAPRWEDDPIARMLGVADKGCPTCGKGYVE